MSTRRSANERRSARARAIFHIFVFDEGVEIEVVKDTNAMRPKMPSREIVSVAQLLKGVWKR